MDEHRLILETLRKGNGKLAGELVKEQKIKAWDVVIKFMETRHENEKWNSKNQLRVSR
jgi:hypothetical protein